MKDNAGNPFDSIESAHNFVRLLADAVAESKHDVDADVDRELKSVSTSSKRLRALQMAAYSLEKLELHLSKSRRILNDLRSLRRLLQEERIISKLNAPLIKPAMKQNASAAQGTFTVSPHPGNGNSSRATIAH